MCTPLRKDNKGQRARSYGNKVVMQDQTPPRERGIERRKKSKESQLGALAVCERVIGFLHRRIYYGAAFRCQGFRLPFQTS